MKLSRYTDYALRVLMFAALKRQAFLLDDVTTAYSISRNHLAKVVPRLAMLGYLKTHRGRGGGVELAGPAEEMRLGSLMRRIQQQPAFVECFVAHRSTCPLTAHCQLKDALAEALEAFYQTLDRYTLNDLVVGPREPDLRRILLG